MVSILIVDDEPVLLDMSKTFIERMGDYEIDTAESAIDALEMIQDRYYDVIISDYEMPVMNGIAFLKEIRSREIDIPFIIFTGRGREEVAIEALNFGADYYLQKGGNNKALFAELVNFIRKTVEQKRAKKELVASEKRYRAVVECQTELISRFLPNGTHVFANEAFCRYYDIPYEKLMGRIFIPNVPVDDKRKIADHFRKLTPDTPSNIIEHRIIMPDGSVRWQQWSDLAVFNDFGMVIEYQSVGRDITEKKEMEISITENLNYVKALMDTIPAPVFYRDIKGIYKDCNKAFEELVGMSKEEIIGKTIHDFFPKELADHYRYKDDLIIEKPHVQQYEYLITDAKGIRYDVLFSKTALMRADGTVGGIVGVIVDISERKEIEKKLQEKLNYVKALMDTMAAPVFLRDTKGVYEDCNKAFEELVEMSRDEIIGKTIHDFFPKELADHYRYKDDLIIEKPHVQQYEYVITNAAGETFDVMFSKTALLKADGTVGGIVGVIFDISDRKKAEKEVSEKLNYVKALMDTMAAPVFLRDTKGVYEDCNKAFEELVEMSRDEIIGKTIHDFFPKELADHYRYKDDLIIEKPHVQQYEYVITNAAGETFDVMFSKTALLKADGTVGGIVGVIFDISDRKRAEKEVSEKLNYVKALMDTMAAPVFLRDTKGVYEDCNKAFEELVGMSRDEIIGKTIHDFFPKELADHYRYKDDLIIEKPHVQQYEYVITNAAGETFDVMFSKTALLKADGTVGGIVGVIFDISDRKRAEKEVSEKLNYVKALMDSMSSPVFLRDINGVYEDCNKAFEELVGMSRDEIIGKTIHDFFPKELADHYRHKDDLIIETPHVQQYEYVITNAAGETIEVLFSKTALLKTDGTVGGIVGVIFDISARKKLERDLEESAEKFRTLAEFTYDWESWIGPDGSYIYVSPSCHRISGYTVEEFMRDPDLLIQITHQQDQEMIKNHYHSIGAATDTIQHIDFRIITKSREERWISHYCQSVFREDGTYLGRRENKRDITQRKQVEAALQRANQKLNLLSGVTRHDVLNQLTVLAGYADLARDSAKEREAIEYIDRIRESIERITDQISFTRIYQDIGLHIAGWQDVHAVIQKSLEFIHIKDVFISDPLKKLELYADPLFEKVLYSFLDNSQRHGEHVTRVSFDMEFCDDGILFIYEDNGTGIPDDLKEKIFESGFGQNTGYGLFLSREILGISEYTLTEAGTYGKGVKFVIRIPQGMFRFKNN